jgi:hypothetical protein
MQQDDISEQMGRLHRPLPMISAISQTTLYSKGGFPTQRNLLFLQDLPHGTINNQQLKPLKKHASQSSYDQTQKELSKIRRVSFKINCQLSNQKLADYFKKERCNTFYDSCKQSIKTIELLFFCLIEVRINLRNQPL